MKADSRQRGMQLDIAAGDFVIETRNRYKLDEIRRLQNYAKAFAKGNKGI